MSFDGKPAGNLHVHMLVTLAEQIESTQMLDKVIRADVPDPAAVGAPYQTSNNAQEPELYAAVSKFMLHTHCLNNPLAACIANGKCVKNFPKPYQEQTEMRIG